MYNIIVRQNQSQLNCRAQIWNEGLCQVGVTNPTYFTTAFSSAYENLLFIFIFGVEETWKKFNMISKADEQS